MPDAYHNWSTDPRPFGECLQEWMRVNGYQTSAEAAEALGVKPATFHVWRYGRACSMEKTLRLLMTALDRLSPP